MFKIPDTYYRNNEDYITLPAIHKFVDAHPDGNFKRTATRKELMDGIVAYAEQSNEHSEEVLSWIDEVLQEGIKDLYLKYLPLPESMGLLFASKEKVIQHLKIHIAADTKQHICMNQYDGEYLLVSADYSSDEYGGRITLTYCKKLYTYDKVKHSARPIDYPITADYFLDREWLLVRAKPRSNLYLFKTGEFDLDTAISTTTEKEIRQIMSLAEAILGVQKTAGIKANSNILKNKIFKLLNKYSQTPSEIAELMEKHTNQINKISSIIQDVCNVSDLCMIPMSMQADVVGDISNIIEKYLSINWKDKRIFMHDRDAYPVRISATDEEESKVEQTAASTEPLQTKALFFDNKKMLYKSKLCDGVTFRWLRKKPLPTLGSSFGVRIAVNPKGECVFKFSEYTAKEDIENVVFSIISG